MANLANQTTVDIDTPVLPGAENMMGLKHAGALIKCYKYTADVPIDGTPCADGSIVIDNGIPANNLPFLSIVENTGALAFQSNADVLEQETSDVHLSTSLSGLAVGGKVVTQISSAVVYDIPKDILNEDADLESSGAAQSGGITIWLYCYDLSSVMKSL